MYDHISFHEEDFPDDLPPIHAVHHMGYYFAWAVSQGLHSLAAETLPAFSALQMGKISGAEFVYNELGGGIDETCFNDLGNRFTQYYYSDEDEGYGHFIRDYFAIFGLSNTTAFYQLPNLPENQEKLNTVFQAAFEQWQAILKA